MANDVINPEIYVTHVLPESRRISLKEQMPKHISPVLFERNLLNAVMNNLWLMDYHPDLVFREISKAAGLGLYLDPQLGEAYLMEQWNSKSRSKEPQLRIGYRGLIKLARQSGEIDKIYAHEVHKADKFRCVLGDAKVLEHEPDVFAEDRGPIIGYYAVAKYADGSSDFEPMAIAQVLAIRDRTEGWKAFKEGKIKSTPWFTDEVEMSKKTVIRNLWKRLPSSPAMAQAIEIEDRAEFAALAAGSSTALPPPPSSDTAALRLTTTRAEPPTPRDERPAYGESGEQPAGSAEVWDDPKGDVEDQDGKPSTTEPEKPTEDKPAAGNPPPPADDERKPAEEKKPEPRKAADKPKRSELPAHHKPEVVAKMLTALRDEVDKCETPEQLQAVINNFKVEVQQTTEQGAADAQAIVTAKWDHFELLEAEAKKRAKAAEEAGADPKTGEVQGSAPPPPADEDDIKPEPSQAGDAAPGGSDLEPWQEEALDMARGKALRGRKSLNLWLNSLAVEKRDFLRPYDKQLFEAAQAADDAEKARQA